MVPLKAVLELLAPAVKSVLFNLTLPALGQAAEVAAESEGRSSGLPR